VRTKLAPAGLVLIGIVLAAWSAGWLGFWLPADQTPEGIDAIRAWRAKVHADCPVTPWSMMDRDQAVAIGRGMFSPLSWQMSKHEEPDVIGVSWFVKDGSVAVHSYYVQLNCGYSKGFMRTFFDDWNMDTTFNEYDFWTIHARCDVNGLERGDIGLLQGDKNYHTSIYVDHVSDTRVRITRLDVLYEMNRSILENVKPIYPKLYWCPGEPVL
jgi:hypothetical protein